jgi:hypothetical protein
MCYFDRFLVQNKENHILHHYNRNHRNISRHHQTLVLQHTVNVMTMENVHVISMELTQAIDVMNLVVQVGQLPVKDMVHVIL